MKFSIRRYIIGIELNNFIVCHHKLSFHVTIIFIFLFNTPTIFGYMSYYLYKVLCISHIGSTEVSYLLSIPNCHLHGRKCGGGGAGENVSPWFESGELNFFCKFYLLTCSSMSAVRLGETSSDCSRMWHAFQSLRRYGETCSTNHKHSVHSSLVSISYFTVWTIELLRARIKDLEGQGHFQKGHFG